MWRKHLMILMDPSLLFQHFQRPKNHVSTIGHQMSGFQCLVSIAFDDSMGGMVVSCDPDSISYSIVLSSPKINFLEDNPVPLILNALPDVSWVHPILMASQGWWLNAGTLCQRWMARNQWGRGRIRHCSSLFHGWYFSPSFYNYQWSLGSPSNFMNPLF